MKRLALILSLFCVSAVYADIIYTIDLEKALRPLRDRITALENGGVTPGTNTVDMAAVSNCVIRIVTKDYVEGLHISVPASEVTTNVVKQVVTTEFVNDLGFSLRPLTPVTNLVEVTEANEVKDLVDTVNTLTRAVKQLQQQWQQRQQLQSGGEQSSQNP